VRVSVIVPLWPTDTEWEFVANGVTVPVTV
jgi:hypothetical protein